MNFWQRLASITLTFSLAAAVAAGAWQLATNKPALPKGDKPPPAAAVGKVVKEDDLNRVTLTLEAEQRIGLTIAPIVKRAVRRVRVYGGEVTVPAGRIIVVTAPVGGTLQLPASGAGPAEESVAKQAAGQAPGALPRGPSPAQTVRAGEPVFRLLPLLTPEGHATLAAGLADADGLVNNARTQVELTRLALARAKRVLSEGAGSQRQADEAQAAFDLATKSLEAVTARRAVLSKAVGAAAAGTAPLRIDAPQTGIIRAVSAAAGQAVPAGAALFEIADLSTLWVRVPLPVGDLDDIDRTGPVQAGRLSAPPGAALSAAKPVAAPPTANALSSTVDLYYELPQASGPWIPGQRLGVTIPLADAAESFTVPWSAVVLDIYGGAWVYTAAGSRAYVRRRVSVLYTSGADAVLAAETAAWPQAGVNVVTAGATELFGAETGFIK